MAIVTITSIGSTRFGAMSGMANASQAGPDGDSLIDKKGQGLSKCRHVLCHLVAISFKACPVKVVLEQEEPEKIFLVQLGDIGEGENGSVSLDNLLLGPSDLAQVPVFGASVGNFAFVGGSGFEGRVEPSEDLQRSFVDLR